MLGLDLDTWNTLMISGLILAAVAAVVIGLSTWLVIKLQKSEAINAAVEFERYKVGVAAQVAEAKKEGIEAGKAASDALVRAAELEKDAANARLETEKIKAVVAWRMIPSANAAILEKLLSHKAGSVNLRYMDGDPEALYLAIQISQILAKAHWQVAPGAIKPANTIVFGIMLPPEVGIDADALAAALKAAKIEFSRGSVPAAGVSFGVHKIDGAPTLIIGSRTPAVP